jgi:hypothetical protein
MELTEHSSASSGAVAFDLHFGALNSTMAIEWRRRLKAACLAKILSEGAS